MIRKCCPWSALGSLLSLCGFLHSFRPMHPDFSNTLIYSNHRKMKKDDDDTDFYPFYRGVVSSYLEGISLKMFTGDRAHWLAGRFS